MLGLGLTFRAGSGPQPIGQIFTDDFDRASLGSNYTAVGSPTVSLSNSIMDISGGAGNYTKYVKYNAWTTCLNKWQIVCNFQAVDKTAGSVGLAIGIKTASAFGNRSVLCQFNHSSGANGGKSFILAGTGTPDTFTIQQTSSSQTINAGDNIRMTMIRNGLTITLLTENLSAGTSTTLSHTFGITLPSTVFQHNTGNPYIVTVGGNQKVYDWTFSSTARKNIYALFVGDSITHGVSASSEANTWPNKLMANSTNSYEVNAGGGDYTAVGLAKIQEILLHKPRYLVLMLGGNDIRFSISSGTWQSNYASIVSQAQAAGINVIHCACPPDDTDNIKPHLTWLQGQYSGVIDTFNPLTDTPGSTTTLAAAYDGGDGTHPNDTGMTLLSTTINNASSVLP